jgi:hypothetical protein
MIGTVAVASRVTSHALVVVLVDDRLPRIRERLQVIMQEQTDYVLDLLDGVINLVASVSGVTPRELGHEVSQAVFIQRGYMASKLREVDRAPWNLVGGNVSEKLQRLREGPRPVEQVTCRIWDF